MKTFGLLISTIILSSHQAFSESEFLNEALGLSGSLRSAYFGEDKSFDQKENFGVLSSWVELKPKEVLGVRTYFSGRLQEEDATRKSYLTGDVREAFAEISEGPLDFRLGRQIVVWGRGDKINPTDVLSVRNYRLLVTDDEDQRTGQFGVQAIYNFGNLRGIAIWQPEWRSPEYPIAPLPASVSLGEKEPSNAAEQFALKLDRTADDLDFSISYAEVIDRNPDLLLSPSAPSAPIDLSLHYQKIQMMGFDFAKNLGRFGLRGEAAYSKTKDENGDDPLVKNSHVHSVLGIDRTFFGDLNINAQYIYRHVLDYKSSSEISDPNLRYLARQLEILSNQRSRSHHSGSLRMNYKLWNERLESELTLVGWFNDGLIKPKLIYSISDEWRAIVGAEMYRGKDDGFFGRLKSLSGLFAELRWLF